MTRIPLTRLKLFTKRKENVDFQKNYFQEIKEAQARSPYSWSKNKNPVSVCPVYLTLKMLVGYNGRTGRFTTVKVVETGMFDL